MNGESSISARHDGDPDTPSSAIRHAEPLRTTPLRTTPLRIGILGAARIAEQPSSNRRG